MKQEKSCSNKSRRGRISKIGCLLVIISLIYSNLTLFGTSAKAKGNEGVPLKDKYTEFEGRNIEGDFVNTDEVNNYNVYKENIINNKNSISKNIEIPLANLTDNSGKKLSISQYEDRQAFLWQEDIEYIEFDIDMKEDGFFQLELDYYLTNNSTSAGKRSIYIDGTYPFIEANDIVFYRYFKDKSEPVINSLGNETRPSQVEVPGYRTQKFIDTSGLITEPFQFYLEKGIHSIRIDYIQTDMAVSGIRALEVMDILSYEELKNDYTSKGYQPAQISIQDFQAELTTIEKNDPTLRRENDGDRLVIPHSATERVLNIMGAYRWRTGNQKITWSFEVPSDGLYKIALRSKQQWQDGIPSYRQIEIDGKVPFEEMLSYKFDYSTKWNTVELSNDDAG